jgi:putative component of membrane protein insertase Oxa1/YidC/SpoIIIJ protein YidD
MSQSGNQAVSLFQYSLLSVEEQNQSITALLGMLMEEPVLYVPAYGELVDDPWAGYFLSWLVKNCRYGQSISITDEEMLDGFGYSKARWAAVRRLLKKDGYLISRRSGGDTVYSINEKHFSEALKAHSQTRKAEQLQQYPSIPIDRLPAAAMLRSGHKITNVLFYYLIVSQQQYHTPDKRGTTGDWFEYDAVQRNYMRLLSDDEQNKAFKALVKAGLLLVENEPALNLMRYCLNHDAISELTWQYVHDVAE